MDIPIFKQGEVLIVTFQPAIHDESLVRLRTALVQEVVRRRARGVIVDVTSMEVMDSFSARILQEIVYAEGL